LLPTLSSGWPLVIVLPSTGTQVTTPATPAGIFRSSP
jgi:hypothetical protein